MNAVNSSLTRVSWLPAHPVYGGISMTRYWNLLDSAKLPDDPFICNSILPASASDTLGGGRIKKLLTRKFLYPTAVKTRANGEIIHILDHSWADLLPYAPQRAFKIVTVHDLIPLRFPGELTAAQAQRFRSWVLHLRQADAIIADSTYTKQEIQELLKIEGSKIHVILLGVEMPTANVSSSADSSLKGDHRPFLIGSIGSTLERKNLAVLPAALARLKAKIQRKVVLVRVGAPLPHSLAESIKRELGADGLIEHGFLPDAAIAAYYASLDVVVIPSLYEGFGLPVLEGMAARVPVVASGCTSLPEVGGDVAFYFDPHSPEELAIVLARIATEGVSPSQIEAGYERAKSLSWRRCLEGIYQVYQNGLESRRHHQGS